MLQKNNFLAENKCIIMLEKRFQKIKKIGQGTYGSVTKVYDNKQKIFIAIKKIKFLDDQQTIPINALRQITALKQLHHPNIVQMKTISYDVKKKKLWIGFQYIEQTLEQYIKRVGPLSPFTIKILLYQILNALKFIQDRCYLHRDLKPQNIMITKNNTVKLIDFGQAKKINLSKYQKNKQTMQISTLWYKAPQILLGWQNYNNKVQIWALGCIFAQMALQKPLFDSMSQIQQIFKIFKLLGSPDIKSNKELQEWSNMCPTLPKFELNMFQIPILGQEGNDLLKKMLQINPKNRLSLFCRLELKKSIMQK